VSADPVEKGSDHYVFAGCGAEIEGGVAEVFFEHSTGGEFTFLAANVWLEPNIPGESDPTAAGATDSPDVTDDGTTIEAHGTFETFDAEGNPQGEAEATITLGRTGIIRPILPEPGKTNVNSKTSGMEEELAGSATLVWDGSEIELPECGGVVGDVDFFETRPHAFTSQNEGVFINCSWETDTVVAAFGATDDDFGYFADAFIETEEGALFTIDAPPGSVTETALDATFELDSGATAAATATFTPSGSPVTSTPYGANFRTRLIEQALVPSGTIEYSTGDTFVIDDEHCDAVAFENHNTSSQPNGPKGGPAPTNDAPADAILLTPGTRFNTSNVGATPEPELQVLTCPDGFFDAFGRTLWYTVEGTGGPLTFDTAGSAIDTVLAVYVQGDSGLEEIACVDDVESDPLGVTYQAAITGDTEEGVTYYVQVGGYFFPFDDPTSAEVGRIRISLE
jgi:hypothetical protein